MTNTTVIFAFEGLVSAVFMLLSSIGLPLFNSRLFPKFFYVSSQGGFWAGALANKCFSVSMPAYLKGGWVLGEYKSRGEPSPFGLG